MCSLFHTAHAWRHMGARAFSPRCLSDCGPGAQRRPPSCTRSGPHPAGYAPGRRCDSYVCLASRWPLGCTRDNNLYTSRGRQGLCLARDHSLVRRLVRPGRQYRPVEARSPLWITPARALAHDRGRFFQTCAAMARRAHAVCRQKVGAFLPTMDLWGRGRQKDWPSGGRGRRRFPTDCPQPPHPSAKFIKTECFG